MVKIELLDESDGIDDSSSEASVAEGDAPEFDEIDDFLGVDSTDTGGKVELTDLVAVKDRIESICGILANWSSASTSGVATKKRGMALFYASIPRHRCLYEGATGDDQRVLWLFR